MSDTKQKAVRVNPITLKRIKALQTAYKKKTPGVSMADIVDMAISGLLENHELGNAPAGDACDAPGHCPAPIRLAAESRPRYGSRGVKP
jgi:hypothetical protein